MTSDRYFKVSKKGIILTLAALGLVIASATAASYATRQELAPVSAQNVTPQMAQDLKAEDTLPPANPAAKHTHAHNQQVAQAQQGQQPQQAQKPACNDSNIVGTAAGGIGGGVLGSAFGHGTGKTATTIAGALGGAYLGNQYIPTRNVTCK